MKSDERTNQDLDIKFILGGILLLILAIWIVPVIPINLFGAFLIVIFGFFFATVSSRMVGLVGSSNNPVSGMTIATLLVSSLALKATGMVGQAGMTAAIAIGGVLYLLNSAWGYGSTELPAPQATLMKMIVEGVMGAIFPGHWWESGHLLLLWWKF